MSLTMTQKTVQMGKESLIKGRSMERGHIYVGKKSSQKKVFVNFMIHTDLEFSNALNYYFVMFLLSKTIREIRAILLQSVEMKCNIKSLKANISSVVYGKGVAIEQQNLEETCGLRCS